MSPQGRLGSGLYSGRSCVRLNIGGLLRGGRKEQKNVKRRYWESISSVCHVYAPKGHIRYVTQPGVLGHNSEQCALVNETQARHNTQGVVRYSKKRALPDVAWTMEEQGGEGQVELVGQTLRRLRGWAVAGRQPEGGPRPWPGTRRWWGLQETGVGRSNQFEGDAKVILGLGGCERLREYPGRCPGWARGPVGCENWQIVGLCLSSLLI